MNQLQGQTFFDPTNPTWTLYDPSREILVARVAFVDGPDGVFDYKVPDALRARVRPGVRVLAPLGARNRSVVAYCLEIAQRRVEETPPPAPPRRKPKEDAPTLFALDPRPEKEKNDAPKATVEGKTFRLKEIAAVVDEKPILSPKLLKLGLDLAQRCIAPIGQTLDGMVPAGVRDAIGSRLTTVFLLAPDASERLRRFENAKAEGVRALTPKQRFVLDELRRCAEPPTLAELSRQAKCSSAPILSLKKLGLLTTKRVKRTSRFYDELAAAQKTEPRTLPHELNPDQRRALDAILGALKESRTETFLLRGVTGSGKTEVYIDAIEEVVSYGKQAIVLVPEISLTPQTVQRFRARLGDIAVLHSRLTDLERNSRLNTISNIA